MVGVTKLAKIAIFRPPSTFYISFCLFVNYFPIYHTFDLRLSTFMIKEMTIYLIIDKKNERPKLY